MILTLFTGLVLLGYAIQDLKHRETYDVVALAYLLLLSGAYVVGYISTFNYMAFSSFLVFGYLLEKINFWYNGDTQALAISAATLSSFSAVNAYLDYLIPSLILTLMASIIYVAYLDDLENMENYSAPMTVGILFAYLLFHIGNV